MTPDNRQNIAWLACFVVASVAVTGYFVGLQSPMNPALNPTAQAESENRPVGQSDVHQTSHASTANSVIPATRYADMPAATAKTGQRYRTSLADLQPKADLLSEVKILPQQKSFALARRDQNRAFNGAPPTVPHAIDQTSAQSCLACHGGGFQSESLRISKMSHQFLANCTQCHVESNPQHMNASLFRENSFVGLPAPTEGPRAYPGAPPQIPHSTWMRVDCMSCHGLAGLQGIRTTHPWRQNCQQCHAPSATLDQTQISSEPRFLPPPVIQ